MALVGVEFEGEAALEQVVGAAQIFEAGERVAEGEDDAGVAAEAKPFAQALLAKAACALVGIGGGEVDGAVRGAVAVVVDDQGALVAVAVGVGKDVFVDRAVAARRSRRAGSCCFRQRASGA